MKKIILITTILIAAILSGCCYHMGSISNPQIKTIAIAPIANTTIIANGSEALKQELHEVFQTDGSIKVVSTESADCILYGRITAITLGSVNMSVAPKGTVYQTTQFTMTMSFEYTVIIPGRAAPLIATTQVTGTTQFQSPGDMYMAQQNALTQVSYQVAKRVVNNIAEGW